MTWNPPDTTPDRPGWYAVVPHLSDRPVVLWWGNTSTCWRTGAQRLQVDGWMELPTAPGFRARAFSGPGRSR